MTTSTTTATTDTTDTSDTARWSAQIRALACCVRGGVPAILWGAPGAAKTALVEAVFSASTAAHHTSIAALHEPPEYGGYPSPVTATADLPAHVAQLPVGWVLRLSRAAALHPDQRVGLFLDELSNAAPATRSAAMRGVLDGVWGEHAIPRLSVVAASNPDDQSESGYRFSAALANRFCHLQWHLPASVWAEAYADGFAAGLPEGVVPDVSVEQADRAENERIRPVISALARFSPELFAGQPPEDQDQQSGAWPSPRTWVMASRALAVALAAGEEPQGMTCRILLRGLVGEAATRQLLDYWRALDLPDPESLLADPDSVRWPARGDQAYAILSAVSAAARRDLTPERWRAAWRIFGSAARNSRAAFAASAARGLAAAGRRTLSPAVQRSVPELNQFFGVLVAMGGMS